MRHLNRRVQLNRTSSHRRCMIANMLKSLIRNERIETTVAKAKVLRMYADQLITLAKANTLAGRRRAIADLMIRFNTLTPKEARAVKKGDKTSYNGDRTVISKLFDELGPRFADREGGYTRIMRLPTRVGDSAELCMIEYLES